MNPSQPPPQPSRLDLFAVITTQALGQHGVTDPAWITAIADAHRNAFAQLGISIPPPGELAIEVLEGVSAAPTPTPAAEYAPLPLSTQILSLLAALDDPTNAIWVQDVQPDHRRPQILWLHGHQWALAVTCPKLPERTKHVYWKSLDTLILAGKDCRGLLRDMGLLNYRPAAMNLYSVMQYAIDSRKDAVTPWPAYWDAIEHIVMPGNVPLPPRTENA